MGELAQACVAGEPYDYLASLLCDVTGASAVVVWARSGGGLLRRPEP